MDMLSEFEEVRQAQRCLLTGLGRMSILTVTAGLYALTVPSVWAAGMACVITPYDEISIGTPVEGNFVVMHTMSTVVVRDCKSLLAIQIRLCKS